MIYLHTRPNPEGSFEFLKALKSSLHAEASAQAGK
jgi:hypothetical protein